MANTGHLLQRAQADPSIGAIVRAAGALPVSLVGGVVRDALLGRSGDGDMDIVVEGDAIELAHRAGPTVNARVVAHRRFGTAVLEIAHGRWIDLVTARSERYDRPGALPVPTPGSLADDLARRDFAINAIALRLNGPRAGTIEDPQGGRADLDAGIVRILHARSFVDDPSRILRAVRYATRLGFVLDRGTAEAATAAAAALDLTQARVGEELRRLLGESQAAAALELAARLGVPWIAADAAGLRARFAAIDRVLSLPGAPPVPAWALRLGLAVRPDALAHAAVDGWARGVAVETADGAALAEQLRQIARPSELDARLRAVHEATAVGAAAAGAAHVAEWWSEVRDRTLAIGGTDLVAAGIAPGPTIGRALAHVRRRLLDGDLGDDPAVQLAAALEHAEGA